MLRRNKRGIVRSCKAPFIPETMEEFSRAAILELIH